MAKRAPVRAITFGEAIAQARKAHGLQQQAMAAMIRKKEGGAISPQYLNDIEFGRRTPTSDHLIHELAAASGLDPDYLFVLAGKIPDDMRSTACDPVTVSAAFRAFRKKIIG